MIDFVTYEIAKKLKDKGFSCEYPFAMYNEDGEFFPLYSSDKYYFGFYDFDKNNVIAPTISQALKWLRDVKDIDIVIAPIFIHGETIGEIRVYNCKIFTPELNKPEHCGYCVNYEEAALTGIEYALDNLI